MQGEEVIRTIIVDPDHGTCERLEYFLSLHDKFDVVGICNSGAEAVEMIQQKHPFLVIIETDLEDMSGFDVIHKVYPMEAPRFVFITQHAHYAVKAFEYFAFDYMLKPISQERLYVTLVKVKEEFYSTSGEKIQDKLNALFRYVSTNDSSRTPSRDERTSLLPVKMNGRIYFIREEDVQYIVASGYYIEIYTDGKKHLIRQSLSGIIEKLDKRKFLRIHRSVIISMNYLNEISRNGSNDFNVKMRDGASFRISKSYRGDVFEKIGIRTA